MEIILKVPNVLKFKKKSIKGGVSNCGEDRVSFPGRHGNEWFEDGVITVCSFNCMKYN